MGFPAERKHWVNLTCWEDAVWRTSVFKSALSLTSAFPTQFPTAIENKRNPAARALEESFSVFKQTEITLMPEWQEEKT